ncbi:MAG: phytoene/squalene synthase family protein [Bacteroidota bacterium]
MKALFDKVSLATSKLTTRTYSSSFSIGIHCLQKRFHDPIYGIYSYVRFADEIVDSFHDYAKEELLDEFEKDTYIAIARKISLNPVLNSFQAIVHKYNIDRHLIDNFLKSMRDDLTRQEYNPETYSEYIYGSAEVVGLMCLKVFTEGDNSLYEALTPGARKLGAAFQKVNFLRDIKSDYEYLGRIYFPGVDIATMTHHEKTAIERDIEADFKEALDGIKKLPNGTRFGVYVAYIYYRNLFLKIKSVPPSNIMLSRIRIPHYQKVFLLCTSYFRHSLRLI